MGWKPLHLHCVGHLKAGRRDRWRSEERKKKVVNNDAGGDDAVSRLRRIKKEGKKQGTRQTIFFKKAHASLFSLPSFWIIFSLWMIFLFPLSFSIFFVVAGQYAATPKEMTAF
jgi:hypothetical protein